MHLQLLALSGSLFFFLACAAAQETSSLSLEPSPASERFQYYLTRTYSWQKMSWLAADTVLDQLHGKPEWGRGMGGFGCHYASSFGRGMISNSIEFGAIMALKQDTRFHPSQLTGLIPRLRYAAFHAFLATSEGGKTVPAYARFAGITGGALIAPAWHRRTLSASGFGEDLVSSTMDQVQNSLLTEFGPDLERVGRSFRRKIFGK